MGELGHLISYWWSTMTTRLSCTVIEICGLKDIEVTILFLGFHDVISDVIGSAYPNTLPWNQIRSGSDAQLLKYVLLKMLRCGTGCQCRTGTMATQNLCENKGYTKLTQCEPKVS